MAKEKNTDSNKVDDVIQEIKNRQTLEEAEYAITVLQAELDAAKAEKEASKMNVIENITEKVEQKAEQKAEQKSEELSPEGYPIKVIDGVKWVLKATFIVTETGSQDLRKREDLVRMLIAKGSNLVTRL